MTLPEWNVLSNDISKNAIETSETLSNVFLSLRMGMWGEAMFGDEQLLGAGNVNYYASNVERNILASDFSKNIDRRLSRLFLATLLTRLGMWGEVRFGSEDILGTGTLNSFEG